MGNPVLVDPTTVRATAAEAWIWGYALLENYRTMYPQAVDDADPRHVGGFGVFRHYPYPSTPSNTDVVTPNNDTPYSWAWLDLRAEPWVVEVPASDRYYVLPVHDLDTSYVGFIGSRTTGQQAGRYLVAGPGFHGECPADLDGVLRADTDLVGIVGRTYLAGPEDVPALVEQQSRYLLKPLSEHLGAPRPVAAEPVWPVWRGEREALDTLEFFAYLDFLLGFFPVLPTEADLRSRLAELGVGHGDFEPATLDRETREAMLQGIADGRRKLTGAAAATTDSQQCFGTRVQLGADYLNRAVGALKGLYGLPAEEAWYGGGYGDTGGGRRYTVRFPPGGLPPARFFWSATMYRLPEQLLVDNPIDRYSIGDRTPGLRFDDDGGLTLHLAHEPPADPAAAANWLPAPDGPFMVIVRAYGPEPSVLDGRWRLPEPTPAD
ncbi:DUF1254 domain-containing protein [Kitasatospora cinereorecta]|uniref:DUF1254 domain-containing protein n=1 Tax=Kitasatospora cinereorecta TaxID=285560 RepID=A0ABW0VBL4_9ACTN